MEHFPDPKGEEEEVEEEEGKKEDTGEEEDRVSRGWG